MKGVQMDSVTREQKRQFLDQLSQGSLTIQLATLQAKLNRHAAKQLEKFNIRLLEWRVLFVIATLQTSSHGEVHELTGIDRGQLSRLIKKMLADDLLAEQLSIEDHRQKTLTLTPKGQQKFEAAAPSMRQRRENLLQTLSEKEQVALLNTLNSLHAYFDQALEQD